MNNRSRIVTVMCLIMVMGIAGCTSTDNQTSPTSAPTTPPTPTANVISTVAPTPTAEPTAILTPTVDPSAAIVLNMIQRIDAEDYAGAAEFVAEDMLVYLIGMPPTGMEIYRGKEQFQTFLEECCTGQNFVWEVTPERVSNGVVFAESKTWMDFTRQLGVAPNSWHEIFVVDKGKISLYVSMLNEESLDNFRPALREIMPELFEVVLPSGETPVSQVAITFADGTCSYDGPLTLQAGPLAVTASAQDLNWDKYAVAFFTLDEGKDLLDLMASTYRPSPPPWARMVFLKELGPKESWTSPDLQVNEGLLYMVCFGGSPDTTIGNAGPFVVQP